MKINDITHTVTFRLSEQWWDHTEAGRKTADLRVLDEREYEEVMRIEPDRIRFLCAGKGELTFKLTFLAEVMSGCGRHFVMFCWRPLQ